MSNPLAVTKGEQPEISAVRPLCYSSVFDSFFSSSVRVLQISVNVCVTPRDLYPTIVSRQTEWMLLKILFSIFGLSRFKRRNKSFVSCRLETLTSLSHVAQFSVKRHAHWINSKSLYLFHDKMSSSWMQYMGRMSSIPSKFWLCSFGGIACNCAP